MIHHHTKFDRKWLSGSRYMQQTQLDMQTELQMDKVIPIFPPSPPYLWGGERGEGGHEYMYTQPSTHTELFILVINQNGRYLFIVPIHDKKYTYISNKHVSVIFLTVHFFLSFLNHHFQCCKLICILRLGAIPHPPTPHLLLDTHKVKNVSE